MRTSFYILAGGFLLGVVWRSFFSPEYMLLVTLCISVILMFGVVSLLGFQMMHLYILCGVFVMVLGVVRTECAYQSFLRGRTLHDGEEYSGTGMVVREPDIRDEHTVLVLILDGPQTNYETRVRVKVPQYPAFVYGERVSITGDIHVPTSFETESGRLFNYAGFLMKEGIHYEVRNGKVASLKEYGGNPLTQKLLALKTAWLRAVSQLFPEPAASLAGGVIVGAKQSLGEQLLKDFRVTGIIHIVVLSGYNLTLVANSIFRVTAFLPRTVGFGLGVFGIAGFALMVGGGATVLRASIMAGIGMLATQLIRPYLVFRALILAALVMVCWNPFILVYDAGFQLSFLATVGLIFLSPVFSKQLSMVPTLWGLREILSATFATQLAVLPLLLYQIGSVSLVAPIVNALVLPVVPFVMFLGFVAGGVGIVSSTFAFPFAMLAHILFSYIFAVVHFFAGVPFASLEVPPLSVVAVVGMYGGLIFGYSVIQNTTRATSGGIAEHKV